eukprot:815152_1
MQLASFFLYITCIPNVLSTIYYVDPSSSSGGSGSSWNSAFESLDVALTAATRPVDKIWLKGGATYIPSNPQNRTDCFITNHGLELYGGFAGTETNIQQRNVNNPPSIISGDIGSIGDTSDNCYHVIQYTRALTLDSVIIQDG